MPRDFARIQSANATLAAKIKSQGYFIKSDDVAGLQNIDRLMLVLVRCGNGRFLCAVQDLQHFMTIIDEHAKLKARLQPGQTVSGVTGGFGDYVRDVSLPV